MPKESDIHTSLERYKRRKYAWPEKISPERIHHAGYQVLRHQRAHLAEIYTQYLRIPVGNPAERQDYVSTHLKSFATLLAAQPAQSLEEQSLLAIVRELGQAFPLEIRKDGEYVPMYPYQAIVRGFVAHDVGRFIPDAHQQRFIVLYALNGIKVPFVPADIASNTTVRNQVADRLRVLDDMGFLLLPEKKVSPLTGHVGVYTFPDHHAPHQDYWGLVRQASANAISTSKQGLMLEFNITK